MYTDKNKKDLIELIESKKETEGLIKIVKITNGDNGSYFALKTINLDEWLKIKAIETPSKDFDINLLKQFMFEPTYDDWIKTNPVGGHFDKLKEALLKVSGFTDVANVIYDPTRMKYQLDPAELIDKFENQDTPFKIVLIDGMPVVLRPISTEEYMEYNVAKEQVKMMEAGPDEKLKIAYDLDIKLVKAHLLHPTELFYEGIYVDVIFQMLWEVSGFTDDVEVVNV